MQLGYIINHAIDEKGNIINVNKDIVLPLDADNHSYQVNDIKVENNKIIAELPYYMFCSVEDSKCSMLVEFVFDSGITMKEYNKA